MIHTKVVLISIYRDIDLVSWKKSVSIPGGGVKWVLRTSDDENVDTIRNAYKKKYPNDDNSSSNFISIHIDEFNKLIAGMKLVSIPGGGEKWVPIPNDELRD
jgi:hypothetical protein